MDFFCFVLEKGILPTPTIPNPFELASTNLKRSKQCYTTPAFVGSTKRILRPLTCPGVVLLPKRTKRKRGSKNKMGQPIHPTCAPCRAVGRNLQYLRVNLKRGSSISQSDQLKKFRKLAKIRITESDKRAVKQSFHPLPENLITLDETASKELLELIKDLIAFEKAHPAHAALNYAKNIGAFQLLVEQLKLHMSDVYGNRRSYTPG